MINLLKKTALEAGELLMKYFQQDFEIKYKTSHHDLVTEVDIAAQKLVVDRIESGMKSLGFADNEIGFIGEEDLNKPGRFTFVIDPIDGTTNFSEGLSAFAVSIACFKDKNLYASGVCIPVENALFFAKKGEGAFKEIDRHQVRLTIKDKVLEECMLGTCVTFDPKTRERLFSSLHLISNSIRGIRITGSSVVDLCYLADNQRSIALYGTPKIWDIAATTLIIEEAGGTVRDWSGKTYTYDLSEHDKPYQVLACHPKNVDKIITFLQP